MKKAYIAGPLFDDHERVYLEKITQIVESFGFNTFLPHRDAGLVTGDFTYEKKVKIFDVDMEYLKPADLVVALLSGRDVDSGTAAEIGYAYKAGKRLIGVSATTKSAGFKYSISTSKILTFFSYVKSPVTNPASR